MKRIISASYRNDTPAFKSEEFFRDLRNGYTVVRSPYGDRRISLRPEDVFCFVFWTKNPSDHFLQNMKLLRSPFYIQWTITGYGKDIEPNVLEKFGPEGLLERFKAVSKMVGPKRVVWRYDPIFISRTYTVQRHKETFEKMCATLQGYTHKCVISFMDEYGKIKDQVRSGVMRAPTPDEVNDLASFIGPTARRYGITVQTCSEGGYDLTPYGIREAPCIDAEFIEKEFGVSLPEAVRKPNSFRRCLCAVNTDIGSYHVCTHGCKYCYAN